MSPDTICPPICARDTPLADGCTSQQCRFAVFLRRASRVFRTEPHVRGLTSGNMRSDSCGRMGCIPAHSSLPRADLSLSSRHRQHGPSIAKPSHHSRHPPAPKLIVLPPKPQIGIPAHSGWLGWELPLTLGNALHHVVQPVRNPVGAMHRALRRALISRGVCQPMALPPPEITTTKYPATTTPPLRTSEPLPAAAEPSRGVAEGH